MLQVLDAGIGPEPYAVASLLELTKAVDGHLQHCPVVWTGIPQGPATSLALLQRNFEVDMTLSFWRAFQDSGLHQAEVNECLYTCLTAYYLPGYGDCRREVVRYRRATPYGQGKTQMDIYLDQNLQHCKLGDLWNQASSVCSSTANNCGSSPSMLNADLCCSLETTDVNSIASEPPTQTVVALSTAQSTSGVHEDQPGVKDVLPDLNTSDDRKQTSSDIPTSCTSRTSTYQALAPAVSMGVAGKAEHKQQQQRFFLVVVYTFLVCLLLLPFLWFVQQAMPQDIAGFVPVMVAVRQLVCISFIPAFLYLAMQPLQESWDAWTALLHFHNEATEQQFMVWLNASKWTLDSFCQLVWLTVALCIWIRTLHADATNGISQMPAWLSASGVLLPALPAAATCILHRCSSLKWRETVLVCIKLAYTLFIGYTLYAPKTPIHRNDWSVAAPLAAVAQLTTAVCMKVRLSVFLPMQLAHVSVVVFGMGAQQNVLHMLQLVAYGFCLPALVVYTTEFYARKAFITSAQSTPVSAKRGS